MKTELPDLRLESLTKINLDDMAAALALEDRRAIRRLMRLVLVGPARAFAKLMVEFDNATGLAGIAEGARHAERSLARDVRVFGLENLPAGGYVVLSNHPGLTDTLALFSALGRGDLLTIALERPFLQNLHQVSKQLLYLTDRPEERATLVRNVARALRAGKAVMTFPAGQIEPDPDVFPGAVEALKVWNPSAEVFVRLAPGTPIVPVCVRGVTWSAAARNPLVLSRRTPESRQLLASALQLMWQLVFKTRPVTVKVQIGKPITSANRTAHDAEGLHAAVTSTMQQLIRVPPRGAGVSAL